MIIPCQGKKRTERRHDACAAAAFLPRLGLRILPVQGVLTTGTVLGLDQDSSVHRLDGHDHPRLPRMAWLPSALASTRPTACPCSGPQSSGGWPTNKSARRPTLGLKPHMFAGPRHYYCGPLSLCHGPLTLLSEQKLFGDSIIGIVDEKNQKNEKLLTDKTGRLKWIQCPALYSTCCAPVSSLLGLQEKRVANILATCQSIYSLRQYSILTCVRVDT